MAWLEQFPILRRLEIYEIPDGEPEGGFFTKGDVLHLLENAPCLQELSLSTFSIAAIPFAASLASLEVAKVMEITTFLGVLTQLPLLSHLGCMLEPMVVVSLPPITLPQLRSLALKSDHRQNIDHAINCVLTFLTLPNLTRLCIEEMLDLEVVLSFVSRSSCTLDYLDVGLRRCTLEQRLKCLGAFPFLTTLHFTLASDTRGNNNLLTSLDSTLPTLLPQLKAMSIFTTAGRINYVLVVQMLRNVGLQSFHLKLEEDAGPGCDCRLSESWPPRAFQGEGLARLIAGGLEFSIDFKGTFWPEA
ncbi:hypothetical protein B0H16DRAFT_1741608 [Mycena metata]|uniref:Uncharacterized protein n=1 Tax=Mycena metata TaxID=1033252 RepID=A0AAD7HBC8_9AGAR|nr:hypothetical protein B0H16DRAFT_1741608 [Mycena metata]